MLTLFFIYHTCTLVGNFLKISYIWSLNPLDNISSASSKTNILILSVSEKKKKVALSQQIIQSPTEKKRFVNRIKKDGKFLSLVKQQRRIFFSSYTSMGQRKKFWAPIRNWTSDHQILHSDVLPLSHRLYGEQGPWWGSNMVYVLSTARISNVANVMFCK